MEKAEPTRILYMEDDTGLARLIQKKMTRAGYLVDIAGDGQEGLAMFKKGHYDVVAVDYNMPGYNGVAITKMLTSLHPGVPIVMITGQGDELVAVEAMKQGAGDYLVKDIDGRYFETLPSIVERLLERKRLQEEKQRYEDALRESELLLKETQKLAHIGSWKLDLKRHELHWSEEVFRIFGLTPQEIKPTLELFFERVHPDDREIVRQAYNTATLARKPYDLKHRILRKDGAVRVVHQRSKEIVDKSGDVVLSMGMIQDVTEEVQKAEKVCVALEEKEILLREIHHRVKNNMQIIISLLRLQAEKITAKEYTDLFLENENRIRSMALIHEKIYETEDFTKFEFAGYVKSLAKHLFGSFGVRPEKVNLKMEIEDVALGLDRAVYCGLILNELISNAIKYATPENGKLRIEIGLRSVGEGEIELKVSDNGPGLPKETSLEEFSSVGLKLVHLLGENQLEGKVAWRRENGTTCRIRFKLLNSE